MKTAAEVQADPDTATAMELALATLDSTTKAARAAVERDDIVQLKTALRLIRETTEMLEQWIARAEN
jgi:hypothetical protein